MPAADLPSGNCGGPAQVLSGILIYIILENAITGTWQQVPHNKVPSKCPKGPMKVP